MFSVSTTSHGHLRATTMIVVFVGVTMNTHLILRRTRLDQSWLDLRAFDAVSPVYGHHITTWNEWHGIVACSMCSVRAQEYCTLANGPDHVVEAKQCPRVWHKTQQQC